MKTLRADFSKGINAVSDRRMMPDGYMTALDNGDLRSGSIKPFNLPEIYSGVTVPAQTSKIYEFLGQWFFSSKYRVYAAEVLPSQQRVYFCETGVGHVIPQKVVNGVQAQLGTIVPLGAPSVSRTSSETPSSIVATAALGGNLASGSYSYRIAAIVGGGILTPSQEITVVIPQGVGGITTYTGSAILSWGLVEDATGYVVFGRIAGKEQIMQQLGVTNSFVDAGAISPSGPYASTYDAINPLTYVYTYVRNVGGMIDESGPSPISFPVSAGQARKITRLFLSDGFYSGVTPSVLTSTASSNTKVLGGILYKGQRVILTLGTAPDQKIWLASNMQIVFSGMDSNGNTLSLDPYSYTFPTALVSPVLAIPTVSSDSGGAFGTGTHTYIVAAVRGATGSTAHPLSNGVFPAVSVPSNTKAVTISASTSAVSLNWTAVADADGYIIYRQFGGLWYRVKALDGQTTAYYDRGVTEASGVVPSAVNTTSDHVLVLPSTGVVPGLSAATTSPVTLCRTDFTNSVGVVNGDAIYISGASQSALNGVQLASFPVTSLGPPIVYDATHFYVPVYTASNDSMSVYDVPNNNYIKYWNIYRAGDTGTAYSLVAQVPISQGVYTDTVSVTSLGGTISSSYVDESGAIVVYAPPPANASAVALYNGMLFCIAGNEVRWTPTGQPDAWPGVYSTTFPFPPLALKAYGDGLIVFCQDRLYRLDGFSAAGISRHETKADGCIAPYSIQVLSGSPDSSYIQMMTGGILVYLAKRGIMRFNGSDSQSITERVLPYKLLIEPSTYISGFSAPNFWWYPTPYTASYAQILTAAGTPVPILDGVSPVSGMGVFTGRDRPLDDVLWDVRSFAWQNKYFLMFGSLATQNFQANASWCIDLGAPGDPVTTLGLKALDAHVTADGEAFLLLPDMASSATNATKLESFLGAQAQFSVAFTGGSTSDHLGIYRFNPTLGQAIPFRFRTAEITAGIPNARKRWREINLHGDGTVYMRVYVDGALVTFADGSTFQDVDCVDTPARPRSTPLPLGSWGYAIAIEGISDKAIRIIEIKYDMMPGEE